MIDNLLYSLNAVVPIFLIVILGYILKRVGFISDSFVATSEKLVFKIALPVMLFLDVATARISEDVDLSLIGFVSVSITVSFICAALLSSLLTKDKAKKGAFIQGVCRSNFSILGIPIAQNMFGDIGVLVCAIVIPFSIIFFNVYSVIALSVCVPSEEKKTRSEIAVTIVKNIVTNPLIIGVVLGLPFMLFGIDVPTIPDKALSYLANLTTPLALIALGANTKRESLNGRISLTLIATALKLVVLPAATVVAGALLGFRGVSLGVILILFGTPTAVSSYIMAKNMNSDHELAGHILLFTTMLCAITVFIGIFILKTFNLI